MEKGPEIRIIGGISIEAKEQSKKKTKEAFFNHFESLSPQIREDLEKFEYPKSKTEISLINFINKETARLMEEAGVKSYYVPEENLHIIPTKLYKKIVDSGNTETVSFGNVSIKDQGVFFDAQYCRDNPLIFGTVAFHEIMHLKGHFTKEVEKKGDKFFSTTYRQGVVVGASQKKSFHGEHHFHFEGLNEAIVAETEKRFLTKLINCSELTEERKWLISDEAKEIKRKLAEEKGISESDFLWVSKQKDSILISYPQQRKVLNYVCAEIHKEFPDEYQNEDDVYKLFLNAHFTGKLLPIARVTERTFGKGSFRLLGDMSSDDKSGLLYLESLKKARMKAKSKKFT